ncbi:DUF6677 family protein [Natronomonas sp. EA1]|uniref:DUF6677 family protein n=1 Tax=Natronomonas sp. EA1 TaxID=3421655 RepID=UPI003EBC1174
MTRVRYRRPWLAAVLAFLPGLGHAYLREWSRALLWFTLWTVTLAFAAGTGLSLTDPVGTAEAMLATLGSLPLAASIALTTVTAFSTIDAYWLAVRGNFYANPDVPRCPTCGREANPEFGFCHWCTQEFEVVREE